jgi:NADP-dependent 3-hydroxy acid dehydrogenase YdfG
LARSGVYRQKPKGDQIQHVLQKVAVITGASQGIGAALGNAYRDRTYRVVATALSMEPLSGGDVMVVSGDITDPKTAVA